MTKKIKKIIRWLVIILLAVLIISLGIVYLGAQRYINDHLSEYVDNKTNGLYNFGFKNIELNFFKTGIIISDINLTHNPEKAVKLQSDIPQKVFYSFSSTEIRLNHINIFQYLGRKNLKIKNLTVVNPHFKITGPDMFGNDSSQVFDYALSQIRPIFRRYFNNIEIDEIDFVDASYQFFNLIGDSARVTNADRVSVGISKFRTDTLLIKNTDRPFATDDIFVRIAGFKNEMSDSIHYLEIDSMEYSLKKAELKAFGSHLFPAKKNPAKK